MYADDHQTFSSDNSTDQAEEGLHNANKMTSWYEENLLKVNIKKYQSMVLGKRFSADGMDLGIGGVQIEQSQNMKLLNVNIDSELNFSYHISELCRKTRQQIGVLSSLPYHMTSNIFYKITYFKIARAL